MHGGTFFFTVALADRQSSLLVERVDALRYAFRAARHARPFVTEAIVVLPDHIHCLWTLPSQDRDFPTRWAHIKAIFSRSVGQGEYRSASRIRKRERGIWQRRYWEHQIRDEDDLRRHVDYIHFNPVKHGYAERVADWPHSSFHRWVRVGVLPGDWAGRMGLGPLFPVSFE